MISDVNVVDDGIGIKEINDDDNHEGSSSKVPGVGEGHQLKVGYYTSSIKRNDKFHVVSYLHAYINKI